MKDLSKKLLESIKERPNMDTRAIINICAKVLSVPKFVGICRGLNVVGKFQLTQKYRMNILRRNN